MKFVDKLQTDAVHVHLRYLNEFRPSNVHEVRSLIFSFLVMDLCIKRLCSLEVLIIYCMCYFKSYTHVNADKLGKYIQYSCPTTFTSSILYICTVDASI